MKTKTLSTIQKLANVGRVLSKIVFIFSLIGAIGCAAGILSVKLLPESIQLGKTTIQGLVELTDELTPAVAYAAMLTAGILCAGEAVLAKIAERYFKRELADGTPFTFDGAQALMRLGICAIVIPIAAKIAAEIAAVVLEHALDGADTFEVGDPVSVGLGIMMIVAGLLCKHGAELRQGSRQV